MSGALPFTHVAQTEDVVMRTYDFSPLWRSTIGFDRLFDQINNMQLHDSHDGYPPYDIVRTGEESFRIAIALAGFTSRDIAITAQQNLLTVAGQRTDSQQEYVYKGISARPFERRFSLADHVEVERATFEDGLLQIELVRRVPEALKPRHIDIASGHAAPSDENTKTSLKAA
jgi:molecular chaperone IbpA